jgi:hypothetical protein
MTMVYQFRSGHGGFGGIDAQIAGEELERLGSGNLGSLRPAAIVAAARAPSSPLHPAFEWDDSIAAEAHRKQQARQLIGAIVTVVPESRSSEPVRAFVNVRQQEDQSYVPIRVALSDEELRAEVLAQATRELVAWRRRHKEMTELAGLFVQIDAFAGELFADDQP